MHQVGLNPGAAQFFTFIAAIICEALAAQALGITVGAMVKHEKIAFAIAPSITVLLILFGGFYVNAETIPVWLRWCAPERLLLLCCACWVCVLRVLGVAALVRARAVVAVCVPSVC